jgi:hypothetical protein
MHDVGCAILGTIGGNAPGSGFGIDLTWACPNDFLPALAGERRELDDPPYGHGILRAAPMIAASSLSVRTRSRLTSR